MFQRFSPWLFDPVWKECGQKEPVHLMAAEKLRKGTGGPNIFNSLNPLTQLLSTRTHLLNASLPPNNCKLSAQVPLGAIQNPNDNKVKCTYSNMQPNPGFGEHTAIPAFEWLRQEDCKIEVIWGSIARSKPNHVNAGHSCASPRWTSACSHRHLVYTSLPPDSASYLAC